MITTATASYQSVESFAIESLNIGSANYDQDCFFSEVNQGDGENSKINLAKRTSIFATFFRFSAIERKAHVSDYSACVRNPEDILLVLALGISSGIHDAYDSAVDLISKVPGNHVLQVLGFLSNLNQSSFLVERHVALMVDAAARNKQIDPLFLTSQITRLIVKSDSRFFKISAIDALSQLMDLSHESIEDDLSEEKNRKAIKLGISTLSWLSQHDIDSEVKKSSQEALKELAVVFSD